MPLRVYDKFFGGKPGAAAEAHAAMVKSYGKKADSRFYALVNRKKKLSKHLQGGAK
jgi:hypothetical protein